MEDVTSIDVVVVLCDQVYVDRGKFSVLGGMWTHREPGQQRLNAVAFLNVPRPVRSQVSYELECRLRNMRSDEVLATTTANIELEIVEDETADAGAPETDYRAGAVPLAWDDLDLAPLTPYAVEVLDSGKLIAASPFETTSPREPE